MKTGKTEEASLLPFVEKTEKACREKLSEAERKAEEIVVKAKEEAKRLVEEKRHLAAENEKKRLSEARHALESDIQAKEAEDARRLKALEASLEKKLPDASKAILKVLLS